MLVYSLAGRTPQVQHAYGATMGQEHLKPLLAELGPAGNGEIILLDFDGIASATSSYLKATVAYLLRAAQSSLSGGDERARDIPALNLYVMVANPSEDVSDGLADMVGNHRLPLLQAIDWRAREGVVRKARLIGPLDAALRESVKCLNSAGGPVTATSLAVKFRQEVRIGETGWSNRLAELHRLRLIRRVKAGRQWQYELLAREVIDG